MTAEERTEHLRRIARLGGQATAERYDMREMGRRGGQATVRRYGKSHMRRIGQRGLQSLADKYFDGDRKQALDWLIAEGRRVTDPVPENGAHQPRNLEAHMAKLAEMQR